MRTAGTAASSPTQLAATRSTGRGATKAGGQKGLGLVAMSQGAGRVTMTMSTAVWQTAALKVTWLTGHGPGVQSRWGHRVFDELRLRSRIQVGWISSCERSTRSGPLKGFT